MGYITFFIVGAVIAFVCAWVLFRAAAHNHRNRWVWGAVGFVFNIFRVMAWYLIVGKPPGPDARRS